MLTIMQISFAKEASHDMIVALAKCDFPTIKNLVETGKESAQNTDDAGDPLLIAAISNYAHLKRFPSTHPNKNDTRTLEEKKDDAQKIIIFLLENGAPINDKGKSKYNRKTALHSAVENNLPEIVEILLNYDADTTLQDSKGRTAYELAVEKKRQKIKEIFGTHKMHARSKKVMGANNTNHTNNIKNIRVYHI